MNQPVKWNDNDMKEISHAIDNHIDIPENKIWIVIVGHILTIV